MNVVAVYCSLKEGKKLKRRGNMLKLQYRICKRGMYKKKMSKKKLYKEIKLK